MIEVLGTYQTEGGFKAVVIATKKVLGKDVYVGKVEGIRPFVHWDENGKVWGDKDETRSLKI